MQVELLNDWCGGNLTLSGHVLLLHDGRDPLPQTSPMSALTLGPSETAPWYVAAAFQSAHAEGPVRWVGAGDVTHWPRRS